MHKHSDTCGAKQTIAELYYIDHTLNIWLAILTAIVITLWRMEFRSSLAGSENALIFFARFVLACKHFEWRSFAQWYSIPLNLHSSWVSVFCRDE